MSATVTEKTLWRVTLDTRHFHFEAYGATQQRALAALEQGILRHAVEYRLPSDWASEYGADDVTAEQIELDACYRDHERLAKVGA